jgi:hypothetical protein
MAENAPVGQNYNRRPLVDYEIMSPAVRANGAMNWLLVTAIALAIGGCRKSNSLEPSITHAKAACAQGPLKIENPAIWAE